MYDGAKSLLFGEAIGVLFIIVGYLLTTLPNAVYVGWLLFIFGIASLVAVPIVLGCFWLLEPKRA